MRNLTLVKNIVFTIFTMSCADVANCSQLFRSIDDRYNVVEPVGPTEKVVNLLRSKGLTSHRMESPWLEIICYDNNLANFGWSVTLTVVEGKFRLKFIKIGKEGDFKEFEKEVEIGAAFRLFRVVEKEIIGSVPAGGSEDVGHGKMYIFAYADDTHMTMTGWSTFERLNLHADKEKNSIYILIDEIIKFAES